MKGFKGYGPGQICRDKLAEVEALDEVETYDGIKFCTKKLKIGAEIGIAGLIKAQFQYVKNHCTNKYNAEPGKPATAGDRGAATAGNYGAATAGNYGAATAGI